MNPFRADLHCHTICSDGTFSPDELVRLAKASNLAGLSITDHDTIDSYKTALPIAKELNIEMIPGAEFSAIQAGVSVHILGYSFSLSSPVIAKFCERHQERRTNRNRSILKLLAKHNMPVTEEEILGTNNPLTHTIGRPHIALAMIKRGYVSSVNEAFKKYLAEDKSCYAEGESFTVEETIDIIHQAKGLAVIAHPHLLDNEKTLKQLQLLDFDGIECYYANFNNDQNQRWMKIAEKKNWFMTGGSDFHGAVKPQISLGASWVPEETFRLLQKHYQQNETH